MVKTKKQKLTEFKKCYSKELKRYIKRRDKEGKPVRRKDFHKLVNKCLSKVKLRGTVIWV